MKTLKIVGAILILALVVVGATLASVLAFGWGTQPPYGPKAAIRNTVNSPQANAPQVLAPITQTNTQTPTLFTPSYTNPQQYGGWGGCRGRSGWAIGVGYPTTGTALTPLTITQAAEIAKTYVVSLNNPDLTVKQIEEYTNNFYVPVTQVSNGNGAFELLINKVTGIVTPEPGPNMMWNTQYTFGAGWCNWAQGAITTAPTVTVDQAKINAQQYLTAYLPSTTVGDVTTFSGHYTIEVLTNGTPYGMLSVNSFTGQIWYHTWHSAFVQEQEVS
jgi:hypothetical protein